MFHHRKPVYTLPDAFDLLGIGRAHGYVEIKRGRIAVIKNGRRTLVPAESIDAYIALLKQESGSTRAA